MMMQVSLSRGGQSLTIIALNIQNINNFHINIITNLCEELELIR